MLRKLLVIAGTVAVIGAFNLAPAGASHTRICDDAEVLTGSHQRVLVPENETCTLSNATVSGDVLVRPGGGVSILGSDIGDDLRARDPAFIRVDCTGDGCADTSKIIDDVRVRGTSGVPEGFDANYICNGTSVGDDLKVYDSGEGAPWQIGGGFCTVEGGGITVGDDVKVRGNAAPVGIVNNDIGQDLDVDNNTALVTITDNEIGDDLDCDGNEPPPATSGNNVAGSKRSQCAA